MTVVEYKSRRVENFTIINRIENEKIVDTRICRAIDEPHKQYDIACSTNVDKEDSLIIIRGVLLDIRKLLRKIAHIYISPNEMIPEFCMSRLSIGTENVAYFGSIIPMDIILLNFAVPKENIESHLTDFKLDNLRCYIDTEIIKIGDHKISRGKLLSITSKFGAMKEIIDLFGHDLIRLRSSTVSTYNYLFTGKFILDHLNEPIPSKIFHEQKFCDTTLTTFTNGTFKVTSPKFTGDIGILRDITEEHIKFVNGVDIDENVVFPVAGHSCHIVTIKFSCVKFGHFIGMNTYMVVADQPYCFISLDNNSLHIIHKRIYPNC